MALVLNSVLVSDHKRRDLALGTLRNIEVGADILESRRER